jgi:hypothetical protein
MLVLTLSVCAYAGDMDNGITTPPPSAPATASVTAEPTGGEPADSQATQTTVTDIALSVLQSALSVF